MKSKFKVAVIRGKFLNKYEMQSYESLFPKYEITAFASKKPIHSKFSFSVVNLPSPVDILEFPYKMQILNRIFVDAHYLVGLEDSIKGFDIAHCAETYFHCTRQSLRAKKKGNVKKVVVTVWENIPFSNEGIWGRKTFKKNALKEVDHFIAITNGAKEALILEGANASKISVIPPGIDIKAFEPKPISKKGKTVNILFVGRLEACKGIFEIIYAARKILNDPRLKPYKIKFTFVGQGSEKDNLIKLERKLGISKFIVHKSVSYGKIVQEYRNADIFVAPSKNTPTWIEQYNMSLMEAQACGLAIITTKSGGIVDNVGNAGVYIPEADFKSLAKALKEFILKPKLRVQYSKKARKRALEVHDAEITSNKISKLYESLLA